jgi:hypothetical protein
MHVHNYFSEKVILLIPFVCVVKGPAADATDAAQPWGLLFNPVMEMILILFRFTV